MQMILCPFCMCEVHGEICPHCGNSVVYAGELNHLPVGYILEGRHSYALGAALGQGGFGITYIAWDNTLRQKVAIKEYFPTYCSGRMDENTISAYHGQEGTYLKGKARFLDEARMLKSLSDLKSVVNVLDFFEANNSAYLVMEYLEGSSLKDYIQSNGKLPAQQFLQQLKPLMADMEKMHRRGVVHRDIAPDNIILLPDGQLKLIDFGAARSYVGDKSMTVVVKKGFAPIEQYMRKGSNASTDVYALAATIYYCITGIVPPDATERQYGEAVMVAPSVLGVELSAEQECALEKALELQMMDRIQSVAGLADLLFSAKPLADGQKTDASGTARAEQKDPLEGTKNDASPKAKEIKKERIRSEEENRIRREKQKRILRKTVKGVAAAVAAVVVLCAGSWGIKYCRYTSAKKAVQEGNFEKAYSVFASLKDFRDSSDLVVFCRKEADYAAAELLFENGRYREAAEAFTALEGYTDSAERAQESGYQYGKMLLENGEYGNAYEVFGLLKAYKDSSDYADHAGYLYADSLSKEKKYHEAYTVYMQISDYKDSMSLGQQAEYQHAVICVENGQYPEGIAAFDRLKDYQDSVAKCQETRYRYACQQMEAQAYMEAVQEFEQLGQYENSVAYLQESKYLYVCGHLDRTDTVTAQYLDDLCLISYADAKTLYDDLFSWKVTLTAVNTDAEDGETKLDAVPVNTDYLHFRFILEGGKPEETVDLSYKIVWPTGAQKDGKSEWKDAASGYYLDCSWSNGLYENQEKAKTGILKIQIYNKATGKFLGEGTVSLTN